MSTVLKNSLIQLSCVLSMIGSALVIFTWAYPKENRTKPGRILLLWLSVADFLSSLFYIIQTFGSVTNDDSVCQALSLLDIFFPVASFLWTDFIAYYLYLVVHYRSVHFVIPWDTLLRFFHALAWSVSLLVVLLVGLTNHAGHNSTTDDDQADNTAGWCWIEADSKKERFVWELIGGKLVEWSSGLIVIPFFYISVARKLYDIDRRQVKTTSANASLHQLTSKPSFLSQQGLSESADVEHGDFVLSDNEVRNVLTLPPAIKGLSSTNSEIQTTTAGPFDVPVVRSGGDDDYELEHRSTGHSIGRMGYEDGSFHSSKGHLDYDDGNSERLSSVSIEEKTIADEDDEDFEMSRTGIGGVARTRGFTGSTGKYFNRFYLKLFMLPLVFISIRFWSSLRILLAYFDEAKYANNGFLLVMQAFFDPSQGFFNSILFVFFSKSDRNRLFSTFENMGKSVLTFFFPSKRNQKANETNIRLENIVRNQRESSTRIITPAGEGGRTSVIGGVGVSLPSNLREGLVTNEFKSANTSNPLISNSDGAPNKSSDSSIPAKRSLRRSEDDDGSEIAIEDLEDEFECNADDRLSNFSFDSRLDSQSTTTAQGPYHFD